MKGTGPAVPAPPAKNGPGGTCKAVFVFKNPSGIKEKNEKRRREKGRGLAACRCAPPHAVPSGSTAADATAPRWPLAFGFRAFGPPPEVLAHRGERCGIRPKYGVSRTDRTTHAGAHYANPYTQKTRNFARARLRWVSWPCDVFPRKISPLSRQAAGACSGRAVRIHRRRAKLSPEVLNRCAKPGNFATGRGRRGAADGGRASTGL